MWRLILFLLLLHAARNTTAQLVITELMADPTPVVGLPDNEWIELRNISGADLNLQNYRLRKPGFISGNFPSFLLRKDSVVIVTATANSSAMGAFGPTIGIARFPALTNGGDLVYLENAAGKTVHAVQYADSWYKNPLKKEGGWSLEMIDTNNPCVGMANWGASTDAKGGTPGKVNSLQGANPDVAIPSVVGAYFINPQQLVLVFSEPIDSLSAAAPNKYLVSDGIGSPTQAIPVGPLFDRVILNLATALQANKVYTITTNLVTDCAGNTLGMNNKAKVGIPEQVEPLDLVINEILFNPKTGGTDYVEIFNRSNKIIDLKEVYLANRNTGNQIDNIIQLTSESRLIFPGEYMVLTAAVAQVMRDYVTENPSQFLALNLPSFNDSRGDVILLNMSGAIVDEVNYAAGWHFRLINDPEGVSLERIDPRGESNSPSNWTSASSTVGYGTPGYRNSQFLVNTGASGEISLSPKTISPDNDGHDDFLTINYRLPQGGYLANVTIFDAQGRPVRFLVKNGLMGTTGHFRWDGLGDKMQKLPIGIYIVLTEVFNLEGKTRRFKNVVVVARRP